jgi:hypothetical protein
MPDFGVSWSDEKAVGGKLHAGREGRGVNKVTIGALLSCLIAAGCSTKGAYIKAEEVAEVQETVTTAAQLEEALGPPSVTIPLQDGRDVWVYEGVHVTADATQYIPYLNFLIGTNSKECTRLTVLVDKETGELSDWQYHTAKDTEYWAKTSDRCREKNDE